MIRAKLDKLQFQYDGREDSKEWEQLLSFLAEKTSKDMALEIYLDEAEICGKAMALEVNVNTDNHGGFHSCSIDIAANIDPDLASEKARWRDIIFEIGCLLHQEWVLSKDAIGALRSCDIDEIEKAIKKEDQAMMEENKKSTKHW
jgi:hypothetical protein